MPALSSMLQFIFCIIHYGQEFLVRVVATRALTWARPIIVDAGTEVLAQGHLFLVNSANRYCTSHFTLTLALLMFSSAHARLAEGLEDLVDAFVYNGNIPRSDDIGRIVRLVGEVVLLHLVIHFVKRGMAAWAARR